MVMLFTEIGPPGKEQFWGADEKFRFVHPQFAVPARRSVQQVIEAGGS